MKNAARKHQRETRLSRVERAAAVAREFLIFVPQRSAA
jgi:hypothetical protein